MENNNDGVFRVKCNNLFLSIIDGKKVVPSSLYFPPRPYFNPNYLNKAPAKIR